MKIIWNKYLFFYCFSIYFEILCDVLIIIDIFIPESYTRGTELGQIHIFSSSTFFNSNLRIQPHRGAKTLPLQGDSLVIGSMDVAALYPNCKTKGTMAAIEEATKLSGMKFERVNKQFLVKFVSITTKGKSGNNRIDEFLQKPKSRTTLSSFLKRKSESQFLGPPLRAVEELNPQDVRILLGMASARSTRHVMSNHFFSINGQIYKQRVGSPIGMDLSV